MRDWTVPRRLRHLAVVSAVGAALVVPAHSAAAAPLTTTDLDSGLTETDLAAELVGTGVTVSGASYTGANIAAGTFGGGDGVIGFDSGVVLGSGNIADVVGPNDDPAATTVNGAAGDSDLDALSGFDTFDAAVLEFDFTVGPDAESIFFQYVFASEEYNEYVGTQFNDVFGFFVNGTNCATVNGDAVSINTINNGADPNIQGDTIPASHPDRYINNDPVNPDGTGSTVAAGDLRDTQMDGLTTVLTCEAPVAPSSTNHMKLAIADASDDILDANVFIEAGSLTTTPPDLMCVDLLADQDLDVGEVCVSNDSDNLHVTYDTDDGWELTETHLAMGEAEDDIPQTRKGKAIPGQFPHAADHDPPVDTFTYTIPLADLGADPEDVLTIAAHAVVEKDGTESAWGDGTRFVDRGDWATWFTYTVA